MARIAGTLAVTAAVLAGCTSAGTERASSATPPAPNGASAPARVTATGAQFHLDGRPWWPTGFDAYQLATDYTINDGCGAQVDLDAYFGALPPRSLTRFDLYASLVIDRKSGIPDFHKVDAIFEAAHRYDQLVIPVLAAGAGGCEGGTFKDHDWYARGWRTAPGAGRMTYQQWLNVAVSRWRSQPSVAGWEPVGEPEPSRCRTASCPISERSCPSDAAQVLSRFFDDAGAIVHSLDPHRLIFSGLTGGDQCGTVGDDYSTIARSSGVDVLDFHDYPDDTPPSFDYARELRIRVSQATAAGKPLSVNEIGMKAGSCLNLSERADIVSARIRDQRAAGTAGALLWAFVPDPRTDQCTFDIGPKDPLWNVIGSTG